MQDAGGLPELDELLHQADAALARVRAGACAPRRLRAVRPALRAAQERAARRARPRDPDRVGGSRDGRRARRRVRPAGQRHRHPGQRDSPATRSARRSTVERVSFDDLAAFAALPRLTGLRLSLDGSRLVAVMQQPDAKGARYTSSLWEIDLDGGAPTRLTHSDKGETAPAFRPDGSLLFVSSRPDVAGPSDDEDDGALWCLPRGGRAVRAQPAPRRARRSGGRRRIGRGRAQRQPADLLERRRRRASGAAPARTARSARSCTPACRSATGITSSATSRRGCCCSATLPRSATWRPTRRPNCSRPGTRSALTAARSRPPGGRAARTASARTRCRSSTCRAASARC